MKKIYFAGSIRGGREDADLYKALIAHIQKTDTVLTEHVGDLSLSLLEKGNDHEQAIYLRDTAWLSECDLVIAECTCPSLGVGYELAYAEKLQKPVCILYRPSKAKLSAMLKGDCYFKVFPYEKKEEAEKIIDEILKND